MSHAAGTSAAAAADTTLPVCLSMHIAITHHSYHSCPLVVSWDARTHARTDMSCLVSSRLVSPRLVLWDNVCLFGLRKRLAFWSQVGVQLIAPPDHDEQVPCLLATPPKHIVPFAQLVVVEETTRFPRTGSGRISRRLRKTDRFAAAALRGAGARQLAVFECFSLRLSRACLGKKIVFIYK
eukprot:COSAG06_NODE_1278_length_10031_cov_105.662002_6_plen_181_part_00